MNKIIAIFFIAIVANGCMGKKMKVRNKAPENLITELDFNNLLYELYLVEGMFYRNDVLAFNLDTLVFYHQSLFNKYNVKAIHFKESYDYYHADAEKMNLMYDEMIEKYQVLKSKVDLLESGSLDSTKTESIKEGKLRTFSKKNRKMKKKSLNKKGLN